jgi:hypothetical protein
LPLETNKIIKRGGITSIGLTPPHVCVWFKPGHGFSPNFV